MTKIISIANEKGGVGKTTTTMNLGVALKEKGSRVLLIDLDQQANLSDYLGHVSVTYTISDAIYLKSSGHPVDYDTFVQTNSNGVDYIPSSKMLASVTSILSSTPNSQYILKEILRDNYFEKYDYILIDCRPSLDLLVVNAFVASDGIIIPVQAEKFALIAVNSLIDTYKRTLALNHDLKIYGFLITMVDKRTNMSRLVEETLRSSYKDTVFKTIIPRLAEATNSTYEQRSVVLNKNSILGKAYLNVADELINL